MKIDGIAVASMMGTRALDDTEIKYNKMDQADDTEIKYNKMDQADDTEIKYNKMDQAVEEQFQEFLDEDSLCNDINLMILETTIQDEEIRRTIKDVKQCVRIALVLARNHDISRKAYTKVDESYVNITISRLQVIFGTETNYLINDECSRLGLPYKFPVTPSTSSQNASILGHAVAVAGGKKKSQNKKR